MRGLRIRTSLHQGHPLLILTGELDYDTAPQLQAALDIAPRRGPPHILYFDVRGLSFCDCSGLNLLLRARTRNTVGLFGAGAQLMRLLGLAGAHGLFEFPQPALPATHPSGTHTPADDSIGPDPYELRRARVDATLNASTDETARALAAALGPPPGTQLAGPARSDETGG